MYTLHGFVKNNNSYVKHLAGHLGHGRCLPNRQFSCYICSSIAAVPTTRIDLLEERPRKTKVAKVWSLPVRKTRTAHNPLNTLLT